MGYNKEEIERLLIEKIAGTLSDRESRLLEDAVSSDPEFRLLSEKVYQKLGNPQADRFLGNLDEDQAWEKVQVGIHEKQQGQGLGIRRSTRWLSIAAFLLVAMTFALYFRNRDKGERVPVLAKPKSVELILANGKVLDLSAEKNQKISIGQAEINTSGGELRLTAESDVPEWSTLNVPATFDYKITLSDGTRVWLNSASSLKFPFSFSRTTREVYLQGEAFFEVARNDEKPFIVHTPNTDVRVLGTVFNVNSYSGTRTITSLVEGSVATSAPGYESVELKPGYEAIFTSNEGFVRQSFDQSLALSWMKGLYNFHDTQLSSIAEVLSNWYDIPVIIEDSKRAGENFTGSINKKKPLNVFLEHLNLSSGVESRFENGKLYLK